MKQFRVAAPGCSTGFTLIESIIVLVVLSIAAVGIISLQGGIFSGQSNSKDLVVGAQLMQECAELVLRARHDSGYTAVDQSTCATLNPSGAYPYNSFTPSITLSADGASASSCLSTSTTCTLVIGVSKTGVSLTPITLELKKY